jgi:Ser/Thr protein kinase RdoA (MazF antagonist)
MNDECEALRNALLCSHFGQIESLSELSVQNWHGDRFFQLASAGVSYVVRIIERGRLYRSSPPQILADSLLSAQLRTCEALSRHGLPYMALVAPKNLEMPWSEAVIAGREHRVVVFKWVTGVVLQQINRSQAEQIGFWLGRSHAYSLDALNPDPEVFPRSHDYELHDQWSRDTRQLVAVSPLAEEILSPYLQRCDQHVAYLRQHLRTARILVHGDCNLQNVFWTEVGQRLGTVIDFDQIGLSRAVEDLGWVVKWYGLRSAPGEDVDNMAALLWQYTAQRALSNEELQCLPALLWLSCGMNYNFLLRVRHIMSGSPPDTVAHQLRAMELGYRERSERMSQLGRCVADQLGRR